MKRKLLTAAVLLVSAVMLVTASVLGTYAYLASSSAVSNTFTFGQVGIHMRESKVDENGVDQDGPGVRSTDVNSYKLVPGKTYVKDPAITVDDASDPSFLFVKIKNGIETLEKTGDATHPTIRQQMISLGWQLVKTNSAGEELYVLINGTPVETKQTGALDIKYVGTTDADEVYEVFNSFTVATNAAVETYEGAKVIITAFAIQGDTFEDENGQPDAATGLYGYQRAWNAIVNSFPFETGTEFAPVVTP